MPYAMKAVGQTLDQNAGRFEFDFSDSGQQIAAYLVGVTHMSLGFASYVQQKIERISLSNVNFVEGGVSGATITVTPHMVLRGADNELDPTRSGLTLTCIALLDEVPSNVPMGFTVVPTDSGQSTYDPITASNPRRFLTEWTLQFNQFTEVGTMGIELGSSSDNQGTQCKPTVTMTPHAGDPPGSICFGTIDAYSDIFEVQEVGPYVELGLPGEPTTDYKVTFTQPFSEAAVFVRGFTLKFYEEQTHHVSRLEIGARQQKPVSDTTLDLGWAGGTLSDDNAYYSGTDSNVTMLAVSIVK